MEMQKDRQLGAGRTHKYPKQDMIFAQKVLGGMCEYGTQVMGYPLDLMWGMFVNSEFCELFENGFGKAIFTTGPGLAMNVENSIRGRFIPKRQGKMPAAENTTPNYWVGWAMAYYQWDYTRPFREIADRIHINEVYKMYEVYHCTGKVNFSDAMEELMLERENGRSFAPSWATED